MKCVIYLLSIPLLAQEGDTVEKERSLGQQYASEIRRQSESFGDALVQAYVERVSREIISRLIDHRLEYQFEMISGGGRTEPFSLPGGYVFIPARALVTARDEHEFVSMLAHAIGHVELRHGMRTASRKQFETWSSIPLVFMGRWSSSHPDLQDPTPQALVPVSFLKFLRTYELEADRFGVELAARTGYDASAFHRYVERTHPSDSKNSPLPERKLRLARIQETVASLPGSTVSVSGEEFKSVQERVRSMIERDQQGRAPTLRR